VENNTEQELQECLEERKFQKEAVHWLFVVFLGVLGIAAAMSLIWVLISEESFYVTLQAITTRIPAFMLSIISLLGAVLAFERITPHNYLDIVSQSPIACSILMSSFIISVAMVIAWVY
jgi:hypothetical protein